MRAILRPLAARAAGNPIEVIVAGFILATLAYFHVLDAIRHSTFLSPPSHQRFALRMPCSLEPFGQQSPKTSGPRLITEPTHREDHPS